MTVDFNRSVVFNRSVDIFFIQVAEDLEHERTFSEYFHLLTGCPVAIRPFYQYGSTTYRTFAFGSIIR